MHYFVYKQNTNKGFTLIEVLVSLSIFTIVVTIAVSTLLVLIDTNARAQNTQSIMTNLSFALDSMTREVRTGADYYCSQGSATTLPDDGSSTQDCEDGVAFAFNEGGDSLTGQSSSRRVGYRLQEQRLQRRLGDGDWLYITSPTIIIEELSFYVSGSTRGDAQTPSVTVYLAGITGDSDATRSDFNIQTTIAQQLIDI